MKHTALTETHRALGAQMVDFAGYEMPLHYGSQLDEHKQVRMHAGLFDVSHMGVVSVAGSASTDLLRYALANDVAKCVDGQALYSCMLNTQGGVKDDLIVYRHDANNYLIIWNASNKDKNLSHLLDLAQRFEVDIQADSDFSILALQGPQAIHIACHYFPDAADTLRTLKPFRFVACDEFIFAATGYTGELGLEILVPNHLAKTVWSGLCEAGAKPCGLGARDTLRLEAGYNLSGNEMHEGMSPLEANLGWTVDWKDETRDFVGKDALLAQKTAGLTQKLVGLILEDKGVLRAHQTVRLPDGSTGEISSGSFSPTLNKAIALAHVPLHTQDTAEVERRGTWLPVRVVKPTAIRTALE